MALLGIRKHTRKMGMGGQGHLYSSEPHNDGICERAGCGWHAELDGDGFCYTQECKEQRPREVFRGKTPEVADLKTAIWKLKQENVGLKAGTVKTGAKRPGMRILKSSFSRK